MLQDKIARELARYEKMKADAPPQYRGQIATGVLALSPKLKLEGDDLAAFEAVKAQALKDLEAYYPPEK